MINRIFLIAVILGVPLSVIGHMMHWSDVLMFIIYCLTIIALAAFMGRATESLAVVAGPRIGGLLNATFGNAVELIISIFALKEGLTAVVLASLTGSVLGNLLLVGGLSFFIGGLKFKRQEFNVYDARHNSGLLIFAVIVAFVIPEVFASEMNEAKTMSLSVGISIILIILYLAALFFKLVTHRGVYQHKSEEVEEHEEPEWSMWKAITGNAAEHASAIIMAVKNRMGVAVEIAVGSTLQVAMFVAPILVLVSLMFENQMSLVFTWPELIAMVTAVFLTIAISNDGDTNWFEGATLLGAYIIMGIGFYLI